MNNSYPNFFAFRLFHSHKRRNTSQYLNPAGSWIHQGNRMRFRSCTIVFVPCPGRRVLVSNQFVTGILLNKERSSCHIFKIFGERERLHLSNTINFIDIFIMDNTCLYKIRIIITQLLRKMSIKWFHKGTLRRN